ncbi:MAG TPA: four helix bundle protein [Chloroflexi bacterium]|nr:four helix bundle protein [Chloroflexota bacterium]
MASIKRFEDIQAWQAARDLTRATYTVSKREDFGRDFRLRGQIQGSAISVMSNIAEGFDARTDREFIRFLGYARRSATELQSQLYIALDQAYITPEEFRKIYEQAKKVKSLIGGFIRYLEGRKWT